MLRGEGCALGLALAERLARGLPDGLAVVLAAVALGLAEWLGFAEGDRLPVIDRLLPMVLVALCPALAPLDEAAGSTVVAAPLASGPRPFSPMTPITPTVTTAAVAPPTTRERFPRLAPPGRCARAGGLRSRRRAPGSAGDASRGSHTALMAGP